MADDDDLEVRTDNGQLLFEFEDQDTKDDFLRTLEMMAAKHQINKQRGNTCGICAAHPCFRGYDADNPAGLCFQIVRQCRQECKEYLEQEHPLGICRIDKKEVEYGLECHIKK